MFPRVKLGTNAALLAGLALVLVLGALGARRILELRIAPTAEGDLEFALGYLLLGGAVAAALTFGVMILVGRSEKARRSADAELRETRQRLAYALEGSRSAVWDWDLVDDKIYLSADWARMIGDEPRDAVVTPADLLLLAHPDDRAAIDAAVRDTISGRANEYRVEHRVRRADGQWLWILSAGRVVERDSHGRALRFTGINRSIHERKTAQLALAERDRRLRASEEQLRTLIDAIPVRIGYVDSAGALRFCNHAFSDALERRAADIVGRPIHDLLGAETWRRIERHVSTAIAGDEAHFEHGEMLASGRAVDLATSLIPKRAEDGRIEGYYFLGIDITPLKRVDRLKSEFVSTVSHELRTPLTSIRGSLGLLGGGIAGALPDKAHGLIEIAIANCERLVRLINDILDMEKIESGNMTFHLRPLDLDEFVERTAKANEGFATQYRVALRVVSNIPGLRVHADGDRLAQVLANLISNACKFTPAGDAVEIAVTHEDDRVRIAVRDRGPGIPVEFQPRIFQKFSQADSSDRREKGGTGLGLAISKAIVERMGGEIGFETTVGHGTTFYLVLPLLASARNAVEADLAERARVLICEDDPDIGRLLRMIVEHGGFAATVVATVAEAQAALHAARYAAMTVDLRLADGDGLALVRGMRSDPSIGRLPIIVISATAEEGRVSLGAERLGIVDWLQKPIDDVRLVNLIRSVVSAGARPRILHVEDDADVRRLIASMAGDFASIDAVGTLNEASRKLGQNVYDLVLLDLRLPDGYGWELLSHTSRLRPRPKVVVFSAIEAGDASESIEGIDALLVKSQGAEARLIDELRRIAHRA